jgi:hypothetical protein
MFSCPNCAQIIGEYPDSGVLVVVCARCTFKYELSGGTVGSLTSERIELRASTPLDPSTYMRRFALTLAISARETLRFTFDTDRDDDWVRVPQGNRCAVVYNMRGDRRVALLFVVDRTSGERFVLAKPGQQSRGLVIAAGALAGVVVGVVALWSALPFIAAVGIAGVVGVGATKGLGYAMKPRHALAEGERDALTAHQALLGQKRELLQLREAVIVEVEGRRALRQRLDGLRSRMVAMKLDAYADRIAAIDRAVTTLDEQLGVDMRLAAEYDRTIQILDIEYESSVAADALPEDSASIMDARLTELRGVEELRAETTRRLAANAEVERLLRSHSG